VGKTQPVGPDRQEVIEQTTVQHVIDTVRTILKLHDEPVANVEAGVRKVIGEAHAQGAARQLGERAGGGEGDTDQPAGREDARTATVLDGLVTLALRALGTAEDGDER
jgi:hypothetical protein